MRCFCISVVGQPVLPFCPPSFFQLLSWHAGAMHHPLALEPGLEDCTFATQGRREGGGMSCPKVECEGFPSQKTTTGPKPCDTTLMISTKQTKFLSTGIQSSSSPLFRPLDLRATPTSFCSNAPTIFQASYVRENWGWRKAPSGWHRIGYRRLPSPWQPRPCLHCGDFPAAPKSSSNLPT